MKDLEFRCPACGAEIHPNARGCQACGAPRDAWHRRQSEIYDGLDLPGSEDFDYDEYLSREFGEGKLRGLRGIPPMKIFWWVVAVITLVAFVFVFVL